MAAVTSCENALYFLDAYVSAAGKRRAFACRVNEGSEHMANFECLVHSILKQNCPELDQFSPSLGR